MWYGKNALIVEKNTSQNWTESIQRCLYNKSSPQQNHIKGNSTSADYALTNAGVNF